eukprot:356340-Chlamydomonas_euryale.AAC.1
MLGELLAACGANLDAHFRARLDCVAAHAAGCADAATVAAERDPAVPARVAASLGRLRLSALRALLASVQAPASHRPAFLPLAVRLLRGGAASGGEHGALCRSALLSMEGALHPRCAPAAPPAGHGVPQPALANVPPLRRPRMWSAVDGVDPAALLAAPAEALGPARAHAPGRAPALVPADDDAAAGRTRDVPGHESGRPAAQTAAADDSSDALPATVPPVARAAAAHQRGARESHAAARAGGTAASVQPLGAAAAGLDSSARLAPKAAAAMDARQPQAEPQNSLGEARAPAPAAALAAAPVPTAAAAATPAVSAALPNADDESSDSEGSMPDIDSGSGSDGHD